MKPLFQAWIAALRAVYRELLPRLGIATHREVRQLQQEAQSLELHRQQHEQILQQYQQVFQQHQQVFQQHAQLRQQHEQRLLEVEQRLVRSSESLHWIVEYLQGEKSLTHSQDGPLVSIVMPVWNRAATVPAAISSVLEQSYANWELLVIDDGSEDHTVEVVKGFTQDARIRLLTSPHVGVCRARNRALSEARGEIIAYLDSDNTWFPHYLGELAQVFKQHPEEDSVFAAQLVERANGTEWFVRAITFDRERFLEEGGIDLNAFAHRRRLVEELGGFDERLTRLVDWELAIRYTRHRAPKYLPVVSGRYFECRADSVSAKESFGRNRELIRRRYPRMIPAPIRVLYVLWDYPQLTESYIECEIASMRRHGVQVEVWSEVLQTMSPYPTEVPVHHGRLEDVLDRVRPDLVHVHWLNIAQRHRETIAKAGLKMTVRGHGYEFDAPTAAALLDNSAVYSVTLFPHFANLLATHPKVRLMGPAFNVDWFYPAVKNRRLVVRTAAAKPGKGLEQFVKVAALCPDHQFVLVLGRVSNMDEYWERFLEFNRTAPRPVKVRVNLPHEDTAAIVRTAGIHLHTYGDEEPFGMPASIAEALATGAYTLARDLPGAAAYVGELGQLYHSVEEAAALINATLSWSDAEWQQRQARSSEDAYRRFADDNVFRPLLEDWLAITEQRRAAVLFPNSELRLLPAKCA